MFSQTGTFACDQKAGSVGNVQGELVVEGAEQITRWYAVRNTFLVVLVVATVAAVGQEQS